ncbi:hypothetical protein [Oceanobacillus sp. J11TS1]|nr:hypothetical protein [Oceanobacillus sp. J11TS1]
MTTNRQPYPLLFLGIITELMIGMTETQDIYKNEARWGIRMKK